MTGHNDAATSARWDDPVWDEGGRFWRATLREPLTPAERASDVPTVAYGPTLAACVAETARVDRLRERRAVLAKGPDAADGSPASDAPSSLVLYRSRDGHPATCECVPCLLARVGALPPPASGEVVFADSGGWISGPGWDPGGDDDCPPSAV
jgi:hypothetical protein